MPGQVMSLIVVPRRARGPRRAGAVALGLLIVRRRVITRRGGTFDCSLRLGQGSYGKGWVLGIGRYSGERLEWYRVFSYATRPRRVLQPPRPAGRRAPRPDGAEVFSLLSGAVVVALPRR